MKWIKRIGMGLLAVVVVAVLGFLAWTQLSRYPAKPAAAGIAAAARRSSQGWLVFEAAQPNGTGFIIYPGGLVDAAAYAPLAQALADRGTRVVITPMPLELAVLGINTADGVIAAYPDVRAWAIGGHSLGGAMACQYAGSHPELTRSGKLRGLVLWAAYCSNDASALPVQAISIYGSRDGLLGARPPAQLRSGLPAGTQIRVIEGGNHAMFGDYGEQQGDNPASLPYEEARRQVADATAQLLDSIR